jgi:hypothetical protein
MIIFRIDKIKNDQPFALNLLNFQISPWISFENWSALLSKVPIFFFMKGKNLINIIND